MPLRHIFTLAKYFFMMVSKQIRRTEILAFLRETANDNGKCEGYGDETDARSQGSMEPK